MLVVNLHTLQAIHILHLVDDILLNGCGALDGQDVGRCDGTIRKGSSGTHGVILLHQNLLTQGYHILALLSKLGLDGNLTVAALHLTHSHLTVDFGYDCGVAGITSLEQLGYTRQTTGDITATTYYTRNLHQYITSLHHLSVGHCNVTTDGEVVVAQRLAIGIEHMHSRCLGFVL